MTGAIIGFIGMLLNLPFMIADPAGNWLNSFSFIICMFCALFCLYLGIE